MSAGTRSAPVVAVLPPHLDPGALVWLGELARHRTVHRVRSDGGERGPPRDSGTATDLAAVVLDRIPGEVRTAPCHVVGVDCAASLALELAARLAGGAARPLSVALVDPALGPRADRDRGPPLVDAPGHLFLTHTSRAEEGPDDRLTWVASFRKSPGLMTIDDGHGLATTLDAWLEERDPI